MPESTEWPATARNERPSRCALSGKSASAKAADVIAGVVNQYLRNQGAEQFLTIAHRYDLERSICMVTITSHPNIPQNTSTPSAKKKAIGEHSKDGAYRSAMRLRSSASAKEKNTATALKSRKLDGSRANSKASANGRHAVQRP